MLYPTFTRQTDPFAMMRAVMRDFDHVFAPASPATRASAAVFPPVNLWDNDDAVVVTAELPGVDPADIEISVKDNVLTLSGSRKAPDLPEGARWHRNERSYGAFSRTVRLPFVADEQRVEARFQNGVLQVLIGRPEADKPRKIEIKAA